jgi:tRNA1(Val) A37 N6-methylase TrmN6
MSNENIQKPNLSNTLKEGERLDFLGISNLAIIQNGLEYCFTSDSVILANAVTANGKSRVLDLCTGSGIIATIIAAKTSAKLIVGMEIQQGMASRALRSAELNGLTPRLTIINDDIKNWQRHFPHGFFDVVVCNPPYYRSTSGEKSLTDAISVARHEVAVTLNEVVETAEKNLKHGGRFYVIHKAERLAELMCSMSENGITPKVLINIQPALNKQVDTVLLIGKKGASSGIVVKSFLRSHLEENYNSINNEINGNRGK